MLLVLRSSAARAARLPQALARRFGWGASPRPPLTCSQWRSASTKERPSSPRAQSVRLTTDSMIMSMVGVAFGSRRKALPSPLTPAGTSVTVMSSGFISPRP